jgi:hypothetical protein
MHADPALVVARRLKMKKLFVFSRSIKVRCLRFIRSLALCFCLSSSATSLLMYIYLYIFWWWLLIHEVSHEQVPRGSPSLPSRLVQYWPDRWIRRRRCSRSPTFSTLDMMWTFHFALHVLHCPSSIRHYEAIWFDFDLIFKRWTRNKGKIWTGGCRIGVEGTERRQRKPDSWCFVSVNLSIKETILLLHWLP